MLDHKVKKIVIISERLILEKICELIEETDATGYTITSVGGKGSRDVRSVSPSTNVVGDFSKVKIEVIVKDDALATHIVQSVVGKFFDNYSGIAFVEEVEILRGEKFHCN